MIMQFLCFIMQNILIWIWFMKNCNSVWTKFWFCVSILVDILFKNFLFNLSSLNSWCIWCKMTGFKTDEIILFRVFINICYFNSFLFTFFIDTISLCWLRTFIHVNIVHANFSFQMIMLKWTLWRILSINFFWILKIS